MVIFYAVTDSNAKFCQSLMSVLDESNGPAYEWGQGSYHGAVVDTLTVHAHGNTVAEYLRKVPKN